MSSVKVAVRVRPFNGREKEANAKRIIEMEGKTTKITDPVRILYLTAFKRKPERIVSLHLIIHIGHILGIQCFQ